MIREVNEDEYEQLMSLYCQLHETSVPEYKGKTKELWQRLVSNPDYAQQLAEGLVLADGTHCLPAEILPVLNTDRMAVICLHEGKYHQVRRMLAAVGNHVEQLQRVAIGNLFLPAKS